MTIPEWMSPKGLAYIWDFVIPMALVLVVGAFALLVPLGLWREEMPCCPLSLMILRWVVLIGWGVCPSAVIVMTFIGIVQQPR